MCSLFPLEISHCLYQTYHIIQHIHILHQSGVKCDLSDSDRDMMVRVGSGLGQVFQKREIFMQALNQFCWELSRLKVRFKLECTSNNHLLQPCWAEKLLRIISVHTEPWREWATTTQNLSGAQWTGIWSDWSLENHCQVRACVHCSLRLSSHELHLVFCCWSLSATVFAVRFLIC